MRSLIIAALTTSSSAFPATFSRLLYCSTTYPHEHSRRAYDAYCSASTRNPAVNTASG